MGTFRLALAISVLCSHLGVVHMHTDSIFGLTFIDAGIAVQVFFAISGFYMALVLHEKYVGAGSYPIFITQRLLRLVPTYLVTLVLTAGAMALLLLVAPPAKMSGDSLYFWVGHAHETGLAATLWAGISNVAIVGLNELFFVTLNPQTGAFSPAIQPADHAALTGNHFIINPPAWSVSLEIYFYFLAPFLVRWPVRRQIALLLAAVVWRYAVTGILHWGYNPYVYRDFFCQLAFFMTGSLAYRFYVRYAKEIELWGNKWRLGLWVLALLFLFYRRLPLAHQLYWVALPIMLLLIPLLFAQTRHSSRDRLLGELSYPFYLIHFMALVVTYYASEHIWKILIGPFALVLSLVLSWLLYRYVESWSEAFRARLYHRQRPKVHLSPDYFPQEAIEQGPGPVQEAAEG